jgi:membrane protein implicated in regulation of membrane protease activity
MENDNPGPDETLLRLAEAATDREDDAPPPPVPSDGFFWRGLDWVGPYLGYTAAGLTLIAFLVGWFGGESFAWVSFLSLPVVILLLLYVAYLLRRRLREQAATYLLAHQRQEQARLEVARLVLEQRQRDNDAHKD